MAYYDFPHTRNYDQDLGYLIEMFKELLSNYDLTVEQLEQLNENIASVISEYVSTGVIKLEAVYDDEDISFEFTVEE